jgi:hypothetical protein
MADFAMGDSGTQLVTRRKSSRFMPPGLVRYWQANVTVCMIGRSVMSGHVGLLTLTVT